MLTPQHDGTRHFGCMQRRFDFGTNRLPYTVIRPLDGFRLKHASHKAGQEFLTCRRPSRKERRTEQSSKQMQALIAWGSGGMEGLGLGNGRQKMLYLPYAHTDFIFPIIGEELGLRFSLLVILLFLVIIVCGIMIALHAKDRFGLLLGCGVVSLLALQAAVNIGVTTSLLPNKGLPLPFISYGGSNLIACMFGIGLLLNIYRQGILEPPHKKPVAMRVRVTPRI